MAHEDKAITNTVDGGEAILQAFRNLGIDYVISSPGSEWAPFWEALREIAARRQLSVNAIIAAIDAERSGNLSSAIRLFVLESCRRGELAGD